MTNYILKHNRTSLYFKDGDFTVKNKEQATKLSKVEAEKVQRMFNGILLSKPIELIKI